MLGCWSPERQRARAAECGTSRGRGDEDRLARESERAVAAFRLAVWIWFVGNGSHEWRGRSHRPDDTLEPGSVLRRAREVGRRLDERVDDLSGAGVAVAGWKECVDVTPAYALLDRAYSHAAVVVDEEARYPADADSAKDQTAGGKWLACDRHDARVEA